MESARINCNQSDVAVAIIKQVHEYLYENFVPCVNFVPRATEQCRCGVGLFCQYSNNLHVCGSVSLGAKWYKSFSLLCSLLDHTVLDQATYLGEVMSSIHSKIIAQSWVTEKHIQSSM